MNPKLSLVPRKPDNGVVHVYLLQRLGYGGVAEHLGLLAGEHPVHATLAAEEVDRPERIFTPSLSECDSSDVGHEVESTAAHRVAGHLPDGLVSAEQQEVVAVRDQGVDDISRQPGVAVVSRYSLRFERDGREVVPVQRVSKRTHKPVSRLRDHPRQDNSSPPSGRQIGSPASPVRGQVARGGCPQGWKPTSPEPSDVVVPVAKIGVAAKNGRVNVAGVYRQDCASGSRRGVSV